MYPGLRLPLVAHPARRQATPAAPLTRPPARPWWQTPPASARNACRVTTASIPFRWAFPLRRARCAQEMRAPACVRRDGSRRESCTGRGTRRRAHCALPAAQRALQRQRQFAQPLRLRPDRSLFVAAHVLVRNSPLRPRAHSSRQASSCSLKARASISNCRDRFRRAGPSSTCSSSLPHSLPSSPLPHRRRCAASAASRSISLPSAPTRKSHSMRTPSFSSGM